MSLRIDAHRAVWTNAIELRIGQVRDGVLHVAKPLTLVEAQMGAHADPVISLDVTEAQVLMDSLWYCGIRPTEGSGSAGSLKATQDHLKDMQKIAFHFLESK